MSLDLNYKMFFENIHENTPTTFFGDKGAGALFIAKDTGRLLLFHRSNYVNEPNTWNLVGGKIDSDESPKDAVEREIEEETGYSGNLKLALIHVFRHKNFTYSNFIAIVPFEFTPELNWEHSNSAWVEYGQWKSPLHFGLIDVIKHSGEKIQNIISTIKSRNMSEAMDTPPEIVNVRKHVAPDAGKISSDFISYIKMVENGSKVGFKNGKWFPHKSPEGGNPTIGYGHKIQNNELSNFQNGISDREVDKLLMDDIEKSRKQVYVDIEKMFNVKLLLDTKQEEILIDYVFNLGTLKKFPKFVKAVLNKDYLTARQEYKRTFSDASGNRHELGRNKHFFNRYLKNI